MVPLYVFSLILGGGFLAMSVLGDLLGGHGDVDVGGDLGGLDGHLELDAGGVDLDAGGLELDGGSLDMDAGHLDVDTAHAELDTDAGHLASKIFSIRTLFYSLFGFGSVGTLLTYVWSGNPLLTAVFAVMSGLSSGATDQLRFRVRAAFGVRAGPDRGFLRRPLGSGDASYPTRNSREGRGGAGGKAG